MDVVIASVNPNILKVKKAPFALPDSPGLFKASPAPKNPQWGKFTAGGNLYLRVGDDLWEVSKTKAVEWVGRIDWSAPGGAEVDVSADEPAAGRKKVDAFLN